jgi:hypothetical protein
MTDYKDVFGGEAEPWRMPLGALRLTLTPSDSEPWVTEADGVRHSQYDAAYVGQYGREEMVYSPRLESDPQHIIDRARVDCEWLVRALNGVSE